MATYLRKTKATIARMRLSGGLPYVPGRPPMVAKTDFLAYLEQKRRSREKPAKKSFSEMSPSEQIANARAYAWKMKLKPIRRRRPKSDAC